MLAIPRDRLLCASCASCGCTVRLNPQRAGGRPGLFNPDKASRRALLEPGGSYRISGRRGTHLQLLLQVLDAWPLIALGQNRGVIDVDALGVAPGQDFELFLGGARRAGHWFPLAEDARTLVVRMTFGDWAAETPSELRIERLDAAREEAPGSRFSRAAEYLEQTLELWTGTFMLRMKLVPVNELRAPAPTRDGLAGQYSVLARFELAPDEALLITSPVSAASYQGIQLGDPWFATPDWAHRQVSLNRSQARADAHGKLRYVVSASDPGVGASVGGGALRSLPDTAAEPSRLSVPAFRQNQEATPGQEHLLRPSIARVWPSSGSSDGRAAPPVELLAQEDLGAGEVPFLGQQSDEVAVFAEGFEAGNAGAWSSLVP